MGKDDPSEAGMVKIFPYRLVGNDFLALELYGIFAFAFAVAGEESNFIFTRLQRDQLDESAVGIDKNRFPVDAEGGTGGHPTGEADRFVTGRHLFRRGRGDEDSRTFLSRRNHPVAGPVPEAPPQDFTPFQSGDVKRGKILM